MDFVGGTLVPIVLVFAGVLMGGLEIVAHIRQRYSSGFLPRARVRLVRRLLGCASIIGIGVLVHVYVHQVAPTLTKQNTGPALRVIFSCLGLVSIAVVLAVWDAIDSVRRAVDQMQNDEISELEATFKKYQHRIRN